MVWSENEPERKGEEQGGYGTTHPRVSAVTNSGSTSKIAKCREKNWFAEKKNHKQENNKKDTQTGRQEDTHSQLTYEHLATWTH